MAKSSSRKFKLCGWGVIPVAACALLTLGLRLMMGQDIIIELLYSRAQIHSFQAILENEECYRALKERLSYSSIWHIGTTETGTGFVHTFYFGGKKLNLARVEGLAITTAFSGEDRYTVEKIEHEFAHLEPGGPPAIREPAGLDVFRAALNDEGVRGVILTSIEDHRLRFQGLFVETIQPSLKFRFSVTAPIPGSEEPFVKRWSVLKENEGSPYVFLNEQN